MWTYIAARESTTEFCCLKLGTPKEQENDIGKQLMSASDKEKERKRTPLYIFIASNKCLVLFYVLDMQAKFFQSCISQGREDRKESCKYLIVCLIVIHAMQEMKQGLRIEFRDRWIF